jgi:Domain of unknown function (DUF4160)
VHIHVEKDGHEATFWLNPNVHLAYNGGCSSRILRELESIVAADRDRIGRAWNEFFG